MTKCLKVFSILYFMKVIKLNFYLQKFTKHKLNVHLMHIHYH